MRVLFLALLPLLVAGAAALDSYTIEDIKQLTYILESEAHLCTSELAASNTLASVTNERIDKVKGKYLKNLNLYNKQQQGQMRSYAAQIKGLQHQLDDALASLSASQAISVELTTNLGATLELINHYKMITEDQFHACKDVLDDYWHLRPDFSRNLKTSLGYLGGELDVAQMELQVLKEFVDNRKCEHLSGYLDPEGGKVYVNFKTQFSTAPNVSVSVTGFYADLDDLHFYSKTKTYDGISIMKDVHEISEYGFYLFTPDVSGGKVQVQTVYCSVMACQGIDDMVDVTESDGDIPIGKGPVKGPVKGEVEVEPVFTPPADVTLDLLETAIGDGVRGGVSGI